MSGDRTALPRVLFVRNARGHTEISGPETYMMTIMPALRAQGIEVFLHCTINPRLGRPTWLSSFEDLGVPVHIHRIASAIGASDIKSTMQNARTTGATILQSFDHRSDIVALAAARRMGLAAVASFAGWTNWTGASLKERLYMRADRFALNRADAVLIDSRYVGQRAGLKSGPRPVVVLPNGVDPGRFSKQADGALKKRLFGDETVLLLAIVGRIHPNKGQLDFVRAAADLADHHPRARFLIVGAAPEGHQGYEAAVAALIAQSGLQDKCHRIVARPDEIPGIMAATDILLAPCHTESCSFAIIEAMASGKAVVAARAGGNPELVAENATGLLVAPHSWQELRDGADRLLRDADLRAALGRAALARVLDNYTIDRMTGRTRQVYEAALSAPGQPARLKERLAHENFTLL